jgi:hypothetical protein
VYWTELVNTVQLVVSSSDDDEFIWFHNNDLLDFLMRCAHHVDG